MLDIRARWVWIRLDPDKNEYAYFTDIFSFSGKRAVFTVAAETDYVLYINGKVASFGQYASYADKKYYDEIDITSLCCNKGDNRFELTVRYEGLDSATHIDDGAGVIFSLDTEKENLLYSHEGIAVGFDSRYSQHVERLITPQLGFSSDMVCKAPAADMPAVEVEKSYYLMPRPVKKTAMAGFVPGMLMRNDNSRQIYDLGRESVGYIKLVGLSDMPCTVKVAYGEHIADGGVRYIIGERDFSLNFDVCADDFSFEQYFIRVCGRYLEVFAPENVKIYSIGLIEYLYPIDEIPISLDGIDRNIYDTAVRTLRLCMNSHYEDCPWREQAMYVLDSRNQMLCGYYAFSGTDFQRANLSFISKGVRSDGLLELTYPAKNTPAIPFFSVMYPVLVYEYMTHTNDIATVRKALSTMRGIMDTMLSRIGEDGLVAELEAPYWNFYEWNIASNGVYSGSTDISGRTIKHLILNCALVYSADRFKKICERLGESFCFDTEATKKAIEREFLNRDIGIFRTSTLHRDDYSQLGNAFALIIGLGDERTVKAVKECNGMTAATLSMLGFVYDALMERDIFCREYILDDIRKKYGYMLKNGATTFWETINGERDFDGAGSLCHGWSAIPVYYYNLLLK